MAEHQDYPSERRIDLVERHLIFVTKIEDNRIYLKGIGFRGIDRTQSERQRLLKLLKDYDIPILYHPGKANVVVDTLRRKTMSMGSLAYILVGERLLASDVQALANQFVRFDVLEHSRVLIFTVSRSFLYENIRERQYDKPYLLVLKDMVQHGDAKKHVKYEHQRPADLLQRLEILELKWERITMDFLVGLPRTLKKFDAIWVIMDSLTKSAHSFQW
ncbi:uncharacterized protein [Nicotiana sylvestris]|uniref:uncharacterized protein n=1 Tax=Nicotiana sylvestris TaxID=4096 RepID=UPI00388CC0D6